MSNYKTIAITAKITDLGTAMSEEHQARVASERQLAEAAPLLIEQLKAILASTEKTDLDSLARLGTVRTLAIGALVFAGVSL